MPFHHFADKELIEEMKKNNSNSSNNEDDDFGDYRFIANCLQIGLKIEDLKSMKYTDVVKILLCFADKKRRPKKATQADWDRLAGRR